MIDGTTLAVILLATTLVVTLGAGTTGFIVGMITRLIFRNSFKSFVADQFATAQDNIDQEAHAALTKLREDEANAKARLQTELASAQAQIAHLYKEAAAAAKQGGPKPTSFN